jgi:hypothetical protein
MTHIYGDQSRSEPMSTTYILFTRRACVMGSQFKGLRVNDRGGFLNRSGTQRNPATLPLTVRCNGADRQWGEDPSM